MKRYKQLSKLSLSEFRILLIALFLLPLTALSLRLKGYKSTKSILSQFSSKEIRNPIPLPLQLNKAQSTARMVSIAANHGPYRANCLKKSLLTWFLLKRRGIQTDLKIGASIEDGDFNAHSWSEFQGTVLNDTADVDKRFNVFDSFKSGNSE